MPDDTLYRELNIRVTSLEDQVHDLAQILTESGIFKDPSFSERAERIAVGTVAGGLAGLKGGWGGIGLGILGGFIWQFGSEIISDEDNEKYQQTLGDLQKDSTHNEATIKYLYAHGLISEDAWNSAVAHDWTFNGWTFLDSATQSQIIDQAAQMIGQRVWDWPEYSMPGNKIGDNFVPGDIGGFLPPDLMNDPISRYYVRQEVANMTLPDEQLIKAIAANYNFKGEGPTPEEIDTIVQRAAKLGIFNDAISQQLGYIFTSTEGFTPFTIPSGGKEQTFDMVIGALATGNPLPPQFEFLRDEIRTTVITVLQQEKTGQVQEGTVGEDDSKTSESAKKQSVTQEELNSAIHLVTDPLASQMSADLSSIKFTLLGMQAQLGQVMGLVDPFLAAKRMGNLFD